MHCANLRNGTRICKQIGKNSLTHRTAVKNSHNHLGDDIAVYPAFDKIAWPIITVNASFA